MPLKYLSICSGIEAATVAWHGFGWEPIAFSEIDKFPSAVLAAQYPDVPNLGDMAAYAEWSEEMLAEVDLLVGGTPCQAFSVAGKRESLGDDRGNLSLVFCNLYHRINEIRRANGRPPTIVVWENVPGVLSTKDNAFGCFISGIMGLDEAIEPEKGKWHKAGFFSGEAFRVGYRVLDAQYFGVAQRRRRVFLVAMPRELVESLGERACPSEILSLRESMLGDPPSRGAAWQGFARATPASLTSSGRGVERPGESRGQDDVVVSCPAVARTLTQRMHKGFDSTLDSQTPVISFHLTQDVINSEDGSTHAIGCGSPGGCCTQAVAFTKTKRAQSATDDESWVQGDVAPTQNQFDVGDTRATTVVAFKESQSGTRLGDVHATIDSNKGSRRQEGVVFHGFTFSGYSNQPAWMTGERTDCLPSSGHSDGSHQGVGVVCGFSPLQGGRSMPVTPESPTPEAGTGNKAPAVAFAQNQLGEIRTNDQVMGTVNTNQNASGQNTPMVHQAMQVRRLTPTESEFLQGFPAGYTDVVYRNKPAADGPRYRALGNSMAVPCMWWVGFRLRSAISEVPN
jgi:DNA (cytosine-5)-methyltransferase 1